LQIHREFVAVMARRVMEYEKRFKEFINALCKSGLAEEVYLIGSRARRQHAVKRLRHKR
jgi:nitrate reductase assembly molybdenum cofactor insertion protein NarJ